MAKKKIRQHGGQPALGHGNKMQKLVVTLDPAVLEELKRRHQETGATMAELVRRAVKFWIAGTRMAALEGDEKASRQST
ncbi:MAG: ribbon-helix-helix protein, CopG family [Betaproteobacteria bacterium]|nr:ribbon-helix-helix protein, CopG family [Betaproteobacteria bacterium]MDH5343022.1 ribbon-helix-helix protein, CopG family [Betaproteobacteria bacterium]